MQSDVMEIMKNTIGALLILVTLLLGIIIGILLAPRIEPNVYAQQAAAPAPSPPPPACVSSANVDCITPIMTVASAGIGKLLSNQISADHLTVNGYDVLKLDNNILNVMIQAHILTQDQAKSVAEASLAEKQIRYQPPSPPPSAPTNPKK